MRRHKFPKILSNCFELRGKPLAKEPQCPVVRFGHALNLAFTAIDEPQPGEKWAGLFERLWPAYRQWWLKQGAEARPTYLQCRRALSTHMPEILPVYDQLTELAGGGDLAARFLSVYLPPPYMAGCSQAIWAGPEPFLVRNYDYSPDAFDAVILRTQWLGRRVMGVSDSLIGLLDGINEDGLAVSLTFGGRRVTGEGFGIPLVLRYVLETCACVSEAVKVLQRIPCHMAYNVTLLDKSKRYKTVFVSPDRPAIVTDAAAATNHQHEVEWPEHALATSSVERENYLLNRLKRQAWPRNRFIAAFHRPPLYSTKFEQGFGTLYTDVYTPASLKLELKWPGLSWPFDLDDFDEGVRHIQYGS